jgi:PAS domain S-box-containing protein
MMKWLPHLPLRTRFFLGLVLLLILPAAVIGVAYVALTDTRQSQATLYEENFGNVYELSSLRANLNAERLDIAVMLETPDPSRWDFWVSDLERRSRNDDLLLGTLQTRLSNKPAQAEQLRKLIEIRNAFNKTRYEQVLTLMRSGEIEQAKAIFTGVQLDRHQRMRALLRDLEAHELSRAQTLVKDTESHIRRSLTVFAILGAGVAVVALGVAGAMQWSVGAYMTERRRTEQALEEKAKAARERSEQFKLTEAVFKNSISSLVILDRNYNFVRVNEAYARATHRNISEFAGRNHFEMYPSDAKAIFDEVVRTKQPYATRARPFTYPDQPERGTTYWDWTLIPILDDRGDVDYLVFSLVDVTERKHTEEALQRVSAYNRSLIEASPDPLVTIGADGKITDVNAATETVTGLPRNELIGTDFSNYFSEPDKARAGYEEVFRVGYVRDYPLEVRHRDGHTTAVLYNASVYRDPSGQIVGVFAAARDITQRKRAEEALSASEERFRLIAETVDDIFWISTPGLKEMVYVSPAYERIWGRSRESLYRSPRSFTEIIDPDDKVRLARAIDLHRQGKPYHVEYRILRDDGVHWMRERGFPVRDSEGKLRFMTGVVSDITGQKQLEEELRSHRDHLEELIKARTAELEAANVRLQELDRLKSMFIASMSHELRTPLNTIIGFTGIILQGMVGDISEEQRKQLTMVKQSAAHLLALINDVIDVSKIEADMVELSVDTFDISDLVNEVAASFGPVIAGKGLGLGAQTPERLVVEGDKRRIKQILVNLVGNAVKFTDSGRIDITVGGHERTVEVAVRDTGIGISPTNLPKLFNAFSQVVIEGRPKEGSGLGLYLSRKIARLMRGDIRVQSEVGKGSVFTLALPLTVKHASYRGAA